MAIQIILGVWFGLGILTAIIWIFYIYKKQLHELDLCTFCLSLFISFLGLISFIHLVYGFFLVKSNEVKNGYFE